MIVEYYTDKGKRKVNEDFILSKDIDENNSLHIIADGMGGYSKGDVASKMVSENIFKYIKDTSELVTKNVIEDAIVYANEALREYRSIHKIELGTAIGGAYVSENSAILFWVGDVRLYYYENDSLLFESVDHSLINKLKQTKSLPNNYDVKGIRHIITRSISGNGQDYKPDFYEIDLFGEDGIILISSDGFLESINSNKIEEIASRKVLIDTQLISLCKKSSDNASVLRIKSLENFGD